MTASFANATGFVCCYLARLRLLFMWSSPPVLIYPPSYLLTLVTVYYLGPPRLRLLLSLLFRLSCCLRLLLLTLVFVCCSLALFRLLFPCPSPSVNTLVFHRRSATRRRRTTTTRAGSASSSRSTTRRTARFTGEWGAHVPGRGRGGWNHSAAGAGRECKRLCQFVELSTWCCFVKVDSTSLSILWIATCICVSCFTT